MRIGAGSWCVSRCAPLLASIAVVIAPAAQQQPFVERVEVARVIIDARVLDDRWRPVSDLGSADFAVDIDGTPVRVESVDWIDGSSAPEGDRLRSTDATEPSYPGTSGRLVVILVQKSLEPVRTVGLMRMLQLSEPLLQQLAPADRVAVLSFDSHLRIWLDFTNDFDRVRSVLRQDVLVRHPPPVNAVPDVSLFSRLDQESAKKIWGIEDALRRIGEALEPLPGAKSIVLVGFGFGRFSAADGSVTLMDGYEQASSALQRARTAVFTLNVTQANYNSLQAGLQAVAAETGGLYASTYEFPTLAIARVVHALAGHYVLFVEKPTARAGAHRIDVRLTTRKGSVFARSTYVD
jgi:VWFA-related protein